MKSAAILARLSKEDTGDSLDAQVKQCQEWASAHSYAVLPQHVYQEDDVSGGIKATDRPILQRALAALRCGQVQALILRDLDRLGRRFDTAELIEEHQRFGDGIFFVNAPRVDDPIAQAIANGTGALIASIERMLIAERTAAGRRRKLEHGGYAGGLAPHWLRWNGQAWELAEPEATRMQEVVRRYLAGEGTDRLRHLFTGKPPGSYHHRTLKEGYTSDTAIRGMLKSPALAGRLYWRSPVAKRGQSVSKEAKGHAMKLIHLAKSLEDADRIAEEHRLVPLEVPALIDWPTFARIQRRRIANFRAPHRKTANWLLQGRIRCGTCGYVYQCKPSGGGQRWYRDAGRMERKMRGRPLCKAGPPLLADDIEAEVTRLIEGALADPELLRVAAESYLGTVKGRLMELEAQAGGDSDRLGQLHTRRERLAMVFAAGDIDEVRWRKDRDAIQREIDSLELLLAEQDNALADLLTTRAEVEQLTAALNEPERFVIDEGPSTFYSLDGEPDSQLNPPTFGSYGIRDLVQLLNVRIIVFSDDLRIDATVPIQSASAEDKQNQNCFGSRTFG